MNNKVQTKYNKNGLMRTYIFEVVIEPDEDRWHAYSPILRGARTWGYTKEEALHNIQEVAQLVVESMIEHGEPIPTRVELEKEEAPFRSLIPVRV